jgi:hypothetical protein
MQSACAILSTAASPAVQYFLSKLSKKRRDFREESFFNIKCVFLFCLQLSFATCLIPRRDGQDIYIKFHENPSSGSRVVPCGRTDRHDETHCGFSQFFERTVISKVHPRRGLEGPNRVVDVQLYFFFNLGAGWEWVVNATPGRFTPGKDPVTIV